MQNTEEMFGGESKNTVSNAGREKGRRESKIKSSKIFKDSSVPGFFKMLFQLHTFPCSEAELAC